MLPSDHVDISGRSCIKVWTIARGLEGGICLTVSWTYSWITLGTPNTTVGGCSGKLAGDSFRD